MKFLKPTRLVMAALATVVVAAATAGAAMAGTFSSSSIKSGLVVYAIPKDTINPYETIADAGVTSALSAVGGKVTVSSGTVDTAAAQEPSIQTAEQQHANAIIIAGNDPVALCPDLAQAAATGTAIVSFDSDVSCGTNPNHLFINQANTQEIGESEVQLLGKEIGYKGEIAILSAESTATNQNSWIKYMKIELKLPKYKNMKLVKVVYGNDEPTTSKTVLLGLLSAYPDLRGIISPTTVGIQTAAQYLNTHKSLLKHITLTGLGLPSQMRPYVEDGTVKAFELWNPGNLGYLAGYAAANLASGMPLQAGEKFTAGKLGTYTILPASGGTGLSVVLGPPTVFNKANIKDFNF